MKYENKPYCYFLYFQALIFYNFIAYQSHRNFLSNMAAAHRDIAREPFGNIREFPKLLAESSVSLVLED